MAYLEGRLNSILNNNVTPAKESGLAALEGVKIGENVGIGIYTIPLYHHSFSHLRKAMNFISSQIINDTLKRCHDDCKVKLDLIHGQNMKDLNMLKTCTNDLASPLLGSFMHGHRVILVKIGCREQSSFSIPVLSCGEVKE